MVCFSQLCSKSRWCSKCCPTERIYEAEEARGWVEAEPDELAGDGRLAEDVLVDVSKDVALAEETFADDVHADDVHVDYVP